MKYYFSARYSKTYPESLARYGNIIRELSKMGHSNTNYVHMPPSSPERKAMDDRIAKNEKPVLELQLENLLNSDALICDLTLPSTTVGFQISTAISNKIPCFVLIFKGEDDDEGDIVDPVILTQEHLGLVKYARVANVSEIDSIISEFVAEYVERPYKFNFFLPLSTHNGVARYARSMGVTKSELIRKVIDSWLRQQKEKEER